jgi:anaerobic selenocysteine-containing dehydrogenase
MLGLQSRPYLQATERVIDADGEQRDEATIYLDLCEASGVNLFGSSVAQKTLAFAKRMHSKRNPDRQPSIPQEALLSLILRLTGQGGFKQLLREKHGRKRPGHEPGDFLGERVVTDDGLVHLAPRVLIEQAQKLEADFGLELRDASKLKLITRRAVTTHNSWTHNLDEFVAADRSTNYLYIHPDDAGRLGLAPGDFADVESETATVRLPVRLLSELMPGTVAIPHGWGHQHAAGLSVASKTTGVNVNILAADGPDRLERVSGMAHLTGITVDVRRAAGEQDGSNWSGISPDEALAVDQRKIA